MDKDNSSTQKGLKGWTFFWILLAVLAGIITFLFLNYGTIINSFFSPPKGRVTVLVLGKGGIGHEAPDLTDTIIVASISKEKTALISLPRDIWVPEIRAKLNSAYFYGKLPLAKSTAEKTVGIPVDYGLVIDFSGFKEIVDVLGGIEVDVKNSFTDKKYPIAGRENDLCDGDKEFKCRYETLTFTQGKQIMDGSTSLEFVRSRNAEGDEGTDIAREARQQLIVNAIKNKILSPEVFLNPARIMALKNALMGSIETDMDIEKAAGVAGLALYSRDSIESNLLPDELLEHPPVSKRYDNQYVFIPRSDSWDEIHKWVLERIN